VITDGNDKRTVATAAKPGGRRAKRSVLYAIRLVREGWSADDGIVVNSDHLVSHRRLVRHPASMPDVTGSC
jgi:hypothetical protein